MPCNSGMGDSGIDWGARSDAKLAASVLCGLIRALSKQGDPTGLKWLDGIDWKEVGVSRQEAERWWHDHIRIDAERKAKEP